MTRLTSELALKKALHWALGDYHYWKVFSIDLPQPYADLPDNVSVYEISEIDVKNSIDMEMSSRASFAGDEALGFGLYVGDELVSVQWYWWGERYNKERNFRSWLLPVGAAKSTGLYTVPGHRGKGYAALLKRQSAYLMSERGFTRLYSRIWHSHKDSIRVSEKTGWRFVGHYIEICPFSKRIQWRIPR